MVLKERNAQMAAMKRFTESNIEAAEWFPPALPARVYPVLVNGRTYGITFTLREADTLLGHLWKQGIAAYMEWK